MGNAQSSSSSSSSSKKKERSLLETIDYIATNYIIKSNFKDMKKLVKDDYCNDLVILTSNIIAKNLDSREIKYLSKKIEGDSEINVVKEDNIIYFNKDKIKDLDVPNKIQKKQLCIGIAKYYVKIAHIFAAIVTTINPTYSYKDDQNIRIKGISLMQKDTIPLGSKITTRLDESLCSRRIKVLKNKSLTLIDGPAVKDLESKISKSFGISLSELLSKIGYDGLSIV